MVDRKVIDRIITGVKRHLTKEGRIVLVQSSLANIPKTIDALKSSGFQTRILAEKKERLGPISMGRYQWLKKLGVLADNPNSERLVVVEGRR